MYMVGLGLVFLLLKFLEVGPLAKWEWWQALIPFGLALLWWRWSDWSGHTQRRVMNKLEKSRKERMAKRISELHPDRKRR